MTATQHRTSIAVLVLGVAFVLYLLFWDEYISVERFRTLGSSPWTAATMVLLMGAAWAFALPASVFYFIVPLIYDPLPSALIMTFGSTFGGLTGYIAARYVGGGWIERFRHHRITRFLARHSTFTTLFMLRVMPSSPHGFINYGAGLVAASLFPFLLATAAGTAIKAFIYALAVHSAIDATSLSDAISWKSTASLLAIAGLALIGRLVAQRWTREEAGEK